MIDSMKEDLTLPKKHSKKTKFLIGVRIENFSKSILHDPGKQNFRVGTEVMVESDNGAKTGIIASNKIPNIIRTQEKIPRILRTLNANDLQAQKRQ
ncbi:MAG: sporulation protein, partial [Nitrospinaceae bacterium]|nr:sporulation protein [Nitrospinaceae bacterium]